MKRMPEDEVLQELMADMMAMDKERLDKKRKGPSITIAIGVPKGEEKEEEMMEGNSTEGAKEPAADFMGMSNPPVSDEPPMGAEMEEENELLFDNEEKALIAEARSLGIPDPESMDMRLLKKMVEKKKATV